MGVVLVLYHDSTLVWVKDSDAPYILKWFQSNQGVFEGSNDVALYRAGGKVIGGSSLV